jgi:quercetin dioxygenase-like cupin family protein
MVRYLYAPGAVFPIHAHPQEQITLVIRGRIRFDLGGESVELGPGEVAILPGGMPHGAEVVGDEEVETYNALSPRREADPLR